MAGPSGMLEAHIWQQILDISLETAEYIAQSILRRYKVLPDRHFAAWKPIIIYYFIALQLGTRRSLVWT